MRSKHKAQVIQANPAPTESTQIDRLMDIFLSAARYLMELGRPGRVGWLDGGEKTASRAERAASWRNDPRIQLFFFLLSPRCLEKHKDFDIWAEQRSGNTTMAHADSFIGVFSLAKAQELHNYYPCTIGNFLLPRHDIVIKSIQKTNPTISITQYSKSMSESVCMLDSQTIYERRWQRCDVSIMIQDVFVGMFCLLIPQLKV